jgi:hypothetical protein
MIDRDVKGFTWALPRSLSLPSCSYGCSSSRSPVPELTRGTGIQLNARVSLRRKAKPIAWSAPDIVPIRTQHGKAVERSIIG